ncbi:wax ester/triacylglycerol synthase family O-acyltransferase [Pseudonocardia sp. GCM10023141]|uniref:wax ester/triacylglycerol synthase family O-acyltransferase n=1 Tax=Pseudonocardia sp. GCM10023141 TaxID=3252653 RepID=UPI0036228A5B
MTRRPIPPQDQLWLELDRPTNLLVITSVMWTSEPVDPAALRALVQDRLLDRYPVFRQRAVDGLLPGTAHWEDDPEFDLDRHLRVATVPAPGDRTALERFVGEQRSVPLDRSRPLWALHLLQGYGTGSALVQRFHHAMADGIRLTQVALGILDPVDGDDRSPIARVGGAAPVHEGEHLSAQLADLARQSGGGPVLRAAGSVASLLPASVRPGHLLDLTAETALTVLHTAGSVVKIAAWNNPHTRLEGAVGVAKTAVWGDPVPLELLTGIAHETGTSVGDVCTALVAGAVSSYLDEQGVLDGETADDLAWMVPVNLEPFDAELPADLGNHFALVLAVLPHAPVPFRERLAEVHTRMARIRDSYEPMITFGISRGIAVTPAPLGSWISDSLAGKAVGVLTNVPGPRVRMALAGAPVTGMVGWAPTSAQQALTVCVFSYAGQVTVGFGTDRAVIDDPERLVAAFAAEVGEAAARNTPIPTTAAATSRRS